MIHGGFLEEACAEGVQNPFKNCYAPSVCSTAVAKGLGPWQALSKPGFGARTWNCAVPDTEKWKEIHLIHSHSSHAAHRKTKNHVWSIEFA
jgi:hypothetical protein